MFALRPGVILPLVLTLAWVTGCGTPGTQRSWIRAEGPEAGPEMPSRSTRRAGLGSRAGIAITARRLWPGGKQERSDPFVIRSSADRLLPGSLARMGAWRFSPFGEGRRRPLGPLGFADTSTLLGAAGGGGKELWELDLARSLEYGLMGGGLAQTGPLQTEPVTLGTGPGWTVLREDFQGMTLVRVEDDWAWRSSIEPDSARLDLDGLGLRQGSFAFSSGGTLAAAVDEGGRVRVWSFRSQRPGQLLERPSRHPGDSFAASRISLAFHGEEYLVIRSSSSLELVPLDGQRKALVVESPCERGDGQLALALSGDGAMAAITGPDGVRMIDLGDGRERGLFDPRGHVSVLRFLAAGAVPGTEGEGLALGTVAGRIQVRAPQLAFPVVYEGDAHDGVVAQLLLAAAGSPHATSAGAEGALLVSRDGDGRVRLWDLATGFELQGHEGHKGQVTAAVFLDGGERLLTLGEDQRLKTWEVSTGLPLGQRRPPAGVAISLEAHGDLVAVMGSGGDVHLLDATTGKVQRRLPGQELRRRPSSREPAERLAFSPSGELLAVGGVDGVVRIHDLRSRRVTAMAAAPGEVMDLAFSPDASHLATAYAEGIVSLHRTSTGVAVWQIAPGVEEVFTAVAFSGDGRYLITAAKENGLMATELETRNYHASGPMIMEGVSSMEVSPDGQLLAITGPQQPPTLLSMPDLEQVHMFMQVEGASTLVGPTVRWSPDGSSLAAGDLAGTSTIWALPGEKGP